MPTVDESIHIDAPVDEVWEVIADTDRILQWNSALIEFEPDGPMRKGARAKGAVRVAGKRLDYTSECSEFVERDHYEVRSIESPMAWHFRYTVAASDGGTDVKFHQQVADLGGFFGKLADPLVTRMYSRDVRSNLGKLKELVEAEA